MKKAIVMLFVLLLTLTGSSFAQEQKDQGTKQIKPALLIIDIQNAYLQMVPEREKEVALYYINALIELFRKQGYPVIRIYHHSMESGPHPGEELFEFPAAVSIKSEDPKVIKTYPDAFNKTELEQVISGKGCNTLFLCGLSAVGCVLATWNGATNHDYKAFMVKDALMSHNSDYTNNVEDMFDAVGYDMVQLILENAAK